jgi:hypothetical protein
MIAENREENLTMAHASSMVRCLGQGQARPASLAAARFGLGEETLGPADDRRLAGETLVQALWFLENETANLHCRGDCCLVLPIAMDRHDPISGTVGWIP